MSNTQTEEFIDYFEMLGVNPNDDSDTIAGAFRRKAKEMHPDVTGMQGHDDFTRLQDAYETLTNPHKREKYLERHRLTIASRSLIELKPMVRDLFDDMIEYFKDLSGIRRKNFLSLVTSSRYREYDKVFDLEIPLESTCHNCKGIGAIASYSCDVCGGTGILQQTKRVRLEVPGGTPDGMLFTKELDDYKIVFRVTYG